MAWIKNRCGWWGRFFAERGRVFEQEQCSQPAGHSGPHKWSNIIADDFDGDFL